MPDYFDPDLNLIDYSAICSCSIVIIDGDGGCRKTTLIAPTIADKIEGRVVSLDEFLSGSGAAYWDQIDYDRLNSKIRENKTKLVIEGACVLKVIERMKLQCDYHIFTKCIKDDDTFHKWEPEQYLSERIPLPKSNFLRDIVLYYREYEPFDHCNLVERHICWKSVC